MILWHCVPFLVLSALRRIREKIEEKKVAGCQRPVARERWTLGS